MKFLRFVVLSLVVLVLHAVSCLAQKIRPNILWIVSEDNSACFIHCYGNEYATTPNIDKLAREGFLYTRAFSTCPVCAPARNTLITGAYACSNGNEQMRSNYKKPDIVHTYAEELRRAGYYCTNNSKTDYNTPDIDPSAIWDESSDKAHYKNRPSNRPFFAVFNLFTSHESSIHHPLPAGQLRHNPDKVEMAAYHPDTKEMRHDYAQYYDKIEDMDTQVGRLLQELDESGESENTIVFYYGDNGGVLARSKRYVYESGTRVPLVIRIPAKFNNLYPAEAPGQQVDRLVSFVDFAPTILSIAGVPIPSYMQGRAFLGGQKTKDPEYAFMTRGRMDERCDMSRAVRDNKYRYIRNYMPFRIYGQHLEYLFNAPSIRSWQEAYRKGQCNAVQSVFWGAKPVEELYDMENDPWEIHNLAGNLEYKEVLLRMRSALTGWMSEIRDVGLIPETEYKAFMGGKSMYDYMHSDSCPFEQLLNASELATIGDSNRLAGLISYLNNANSAVRYWAVTGLLIMKDKAQPAVVDLIKAGNDKSSSVSALAAEALYSLGEKEAASKIFVRIIQDTLTYDMVDRNFVFNSIDAIDCSDPDVINAVNGFYSRNKAALNTPERYNVIDVLMSQWLLRKWGALK
jgi:N-sulfoglucosamine sulfohydrolase